MSCFYKWGGMLFAGLLMTQCAWSDSAENTGGLLGGLSKYKKFTAARQSSFDPSGGNADGRQDWPIQPGETREMAKIDGAGAVTHIWVTIASEDPHHLKNLVLRMYWDGEASPSVETPIGDFFGLGHGQYYQYSALPIQIGTLNGLNCFWRMPFSKGARITVTNDGPKPVGAFYYYVDYQKYKRLSKEEGRFHVQYRQEYPCKPGQNYVFFEAKGRGHYVGCNLSIHNRNDGWWGEGDDMIYIDGEEKPSMNGTGSEDYFCGAWCYGPAFSDLFLGCPLRGDHLANEKWNVYRYHLADPIPFTKSIKMTIEHGHANDRSDDFSSCAYWYQSEPHVPFAALPVAADRFPSEVKRFVEEGAEEAEALKSQFNAPEVSVQSMFSFADRFSNGNQLFFQAKAPANYLCTLTADAKEAGAHQVALWYTVSMDYGTCELWVNGKKVAAWDGFNAGKLPEAVQRRKLEFPVDIKQGDNTVELRITGKRAESTGFLAGVDCFMVK